MAALREGKNTALVVVDVQVGVMDGAWNAAHVIANVARAVERARAEGVPVIWVQHSDDELTRGSAVWQWVPALVPGDDELRIYKLFNSSFEETDLDAALARRGVGHIVLAGAATNWCIRATAYGALDRGYDLTLVSDAHTTKSMTLDDGYEIAAESVVRDLNVAMTWLSYPGRKCAAVTADEVRFASH
jgi:nicotinamidase-related amidase